METFKASDGLQLAYYVDDFTEPWKSAPILLLHAAMGRAQRYYAWCRRSAGIIGWCGWICGATKIHKCRLPTASSRLIGWSGMSLS